jgi:hypothetical protein
LSLGSSISYSNSGSSLSLRYSVKVVHVFVSSNSGSSLFRLQYKGCPRLCFISSCRSSCPVIFVRVALVRRKSVSQSCLFDSVIPSPNSGSSLSLDSVKFVHVFALVIHCRFLLRRRVYVSCFEPALLVPQEIRKSEIRMVWASTASPAKSMRTASAPDF